jgi:hypothetical protein
MPKENNSNNSNSLLNLDSEEFLLWKEHPITQLVIKLHQDRKADLLSFNEDAVLSGTLLTDVQQVRVHEALRMYEDFIELEYEDIANYYEEDIDEDDPTSVGKGISATG